jgi:hypothetical protein
VKSREDRKREAWCAGIWVLAVVTGLLLLYVLLAGAPTPWIGAMAPLITATAALGGVYLGSRLSQRQRLEEEQRRRRALATLLLSEVRFVEGVVRRLRGMVNLEGALIQPYETTVYDSAGANLLLFDKATVLELNTFYVLVRDLRAMLQLISVSENRIEELDEITLRAKATYSASLVQGVARRLSAEGGEWPMPLQPYDLLPLPDLPPPVFESNK